MPQALLEALEALPERCGGASRIRLVPAEHPHDVVPAHPAIDPELRTISPGSLIFGHGICQAVSEGAREVDFLRGQERYKYFWGARERPCYGRMLNRVS